VSQLNKAWKMRTAKSQPARPKAKRAGKRKKKFTTLEGYMAARRQAGNPVPVSDYGDD
jgi:hypothetical protein